VDSNLHYGFQAGTKVGPDQLGSLTSDRTKNVFFKPKLLDVCADFTKIRAKGDFSRSYHFFTMIRGERSELIRSYLPGIFRCAANK